MLHSGRKSDFTRIVGVGYPFLFNGTAHRTGEGVTVFVYGICIHVLLRRCIFADVAGMIACVGVYVGAMLKNTLAQRALLVVAGGILLNVRQQMRADFTVGEGV